MSNERVVEYIRNQLSIGTPHEKIDVLLTKQGWSEGDIAAAHDTVILQRPGFVRRAGHAVYMGIIVCIVAFVIAGEVLLFVFTKKIATEVQSGTADQSTQQLYLLVRTVPLQIALDTYKRDSGGYPVELRDLKPKYLTDIPNDPITGAPYRYAVGEGNTGYHLCTTLREGAETCASATTTIDGKPFNQ